MTYLAAIRATSALAASASFALACSDPAGPAAPPVEIIATPAAAAVLGDFVEFLPWAGVTVRTAADPVAELPAGSGASGGAAKPPKPGTLVVAVVDDLGGECSECFRLERGATAGTFIVHGDAPLGVQYGLAALLETAGVGFFHPQRTRTPATLAVPDDAPGFGVTREPEQTLRGLHLHTLHPIESYWAFWEPSPQHLVDARRVLDWTVKNRGNYVQWVALEDIQDDPARAAAWTTHTAAIIAAAHARGVRVGLGIQLFGSGNLQRAWDLIDEPLAEVPGRAQIDARMPQVVDLGFDRVSLSFGEFFGESPDVFIAQVNEAHASMKALRPAAEMVTTIHVGNKPDQRVVYMGQEYQYYFLAQFADPAVIPWVHTVMYYNLFDDAGGAYEHDEFDEHRAFLLARIAAGERVGYHPESAYWITFDNSVPLYLPLYVRSRWRDLDQVRAMAPPGVSEHVLFSSGWEWGFWQHDAASLRMGFALPASSAGVFAELFAPYGAAGAALAEELAAFADAQHEALIVGRLAPYLAGRDVYIDLGDEVDIHSQPDRPSFAELAALGPAERAAWAADVLPRLAALEEASEATLAAVRALPLPAADEDPFVAEILDGLEIDVLRARAIRAVYAAAVAKADGGDFATPRAEAVAAIAAARAVVARRRAGFHWPVLDELIAPLDNITIYPFGYLKQADELCYWDRELVDLGNLIDGTDVTLPGCIR